MSSVSHGQRSFLQGKLLTGTMSSTIASTDLSQSMTTSSIDRSGLAGRCISATLFLMISKFTFLSERLTTGSMSFLPLILIEAITGKWSLIDRFPTRYSKQGNDLSIAMISIHVAVVDVILVGEIL